MHECIHAYLFTITAYPLVGMDIAEVINKVLPTPDEQHDFMYNSMLPVMTKVLGEIRDFVSTEPRRNYLIDINVSPTPLSETIIWNWADYYSNLSLKGLESTNLFKKDFPDNSKQFLLFKSYIDKGSKILDK